MGKIVSTKTTSAIFLAIVLVVGTIAVISPSSFIIKEVNAQGDPYYGMDNDYNSYGYSDYGKDKDKKSYGPDSYKSQYSSYEPDYKPKHPSYDKHDRDKSKDSSKKSININKLKCINTNLNINGNNSGNISIGNKGAEEGYLGAYSSGGGYGEGYDGYKKDKGFTCIINNNNTNTNVVSGGGNATDACEECFNANATLAGIITAILELPGEISLFPVFPDISIGANVTTIAQLCDYFEEQISEGIIPQTGLIDVILAILNRDTEISAGVSEESIQALYECLLGVDFN